MHTFSSKVRLKSFWISQLFLSFKKIICGINPITGPWNNNINIAELFKLKYRRQEREKQWQERGIFLKYNFHTEGGVCETALSHLNFKNVLGCQSLDLIPNGKWHSVSASASILNISPGWGRGTSGPACGTPAEQKGWCVVGMGVAL